MTTCYTNWAIGTKLNSSIFIKGEFVKIILLLLTFIFAPIVLAEVSYDEEGHVIYEDSGNYPGYGYGYGNYVPNVDPYYTNYNSYWWDYVNNDYWQANHLATDPVPQLYGQHPECITFNGNNYCH
jgi:hypothetical protein